MATCTRYLAAVLPAVLLLCGLIGIPSLRADIVRNVLVLHSYHQGLEWTDNITGGIESAFKPLSRTIEVYYEYLDALRNQDEGAFENIARLYRIKFSQIRFDAVLVSDLPALRFISRYGPQEFPGVPVVFCSIEAYDPAMLSDLPDVTGVVRQVDHSATINLMLRLHPDCRRFLVVLEQPDPGRKEREMLEKLLSSVSGRIDVMLLPGPGADEATEHARLLAPGDLIYMACSIPAASGRSTPAGDSLRLLSRWSAAPIYGSWDFLIGKGIVGGMITSGFNQGEQAAQMVTRILHGEPARKIPVAARSPNLFMFDQQQLRRFDISQASLPSGSIITNQAPGVWQRNLHWAMALAAGALVFAGALVCRTLFQRRVRNDLLQKTFELDRRCRESSAELQSLSHKLKKQSILDSVTGLYNRRHLQHRLSEESKKSRRYGYPLALVLLDIDHFRVINDLHGHVQADTVLHGVGQTIRRSVREIDPVGRFGGESFMVIMPNTNARQARVAAERIRCHVASLEWKEGAVKVTLSAGLAELEGHSAAEAVKKADESLLAAKRGGRNRVMQAGQADGPT